MSRQPLLRVLVPLLVLVSIGLLSRPVMPAFRSLKGGYWGTKMNSAESTRVAMAIDEIRNLAQNQHERVQEILLSVATCLDDMLAKNKICKNSSGDFGRTQWESPTRCTWNDMMNIRADLLAGNSKDHNFWWLVGVLVHEGRHAFQWTHVGAPPTAAGSTPTELEWDPTSWEHWTLCEILDQKKFTTKADSANIKRRKDQLRCEVEGACDPDLSETDKKKAIAEWKTKKSKSNTNKIYYNKPNDSSKIVVADSLNSYEIQTPFDRSFDILVELDNLGGDVLVVCGVDGSGSSGGAVMYYDNNFDGLADQATETSLGILGIPVSMDMVSEAVPPLSGRLFVFDQAAGEVRISFLDPDGRPGLLSPTPFATAVGFPFLSGMFSLISVESNPVDGYVIRMSEVSDVVDFGDPDRVDYILQDLDLNGIADTFTMVDFMTDMTEFQPTIYSDPQNGDLSIRGAGLAGSTLRVHVTDASASILGEMLAERMVLPGENATEIEIPLNRPLVAGEYIVLADVTTEHRETAGRLVHDTRPEIFSPDLPAYMPGDTIRVTGRNFTPSPGILLSGELLPTIANGTTEVKAVAPNTSIIPANSFILRVIAAGDTSGPAGLYIAADCNGNGIDDWIDLYSGTLVDLNENGIPDVCEETTSVGPVSPVTLLQSSPNPLRSQSRIEFELTRSAHTLLVVYDVRGRRVAELLDRRLPVGSMSVTWNGLDESGRPAGAGMYFYQLSLDGQPSAARKMTVLR